ncbi:putative small GTP-binding protein [Paratrimastix pyriformis]|uniref:Small GTP-binding protein n=1 Tax=Paratrimastix pyriformis TaxID=342808 RepID=A0ABQ8UJ27_9EUKA|nr:putative small GTP-binding protein [Paratrimastix pyriformis]
MLEVRALASDWFQIMVLYVMLVLGFLLVKCTRSQLKQPSSPSPISLSVSAAKEDCVVAKCVVLGNSGVGKSSFVKRFVAGVFDPRNCTIGMDFTVRMITTGSVNIKLQLWEMAGGERYSRLMSGRIFCRGAHVVLLMFALNNPQSLTDLEQWAGEVDNCSSSPPPYKVLVGCKSDLGQSLTGETVTEEAIEKMRRDLGGLVYIPTSAKNGLGFEEITSHIVTKLQEANPEVFNP